MNTHPVPEFTYGVALVAVIVAFAFIAVCSFIKEPVRQKLSALLLAGAGAVYWSGGMGYAEFLFGALLLFLAYKGLANYAFIGIGWLLHTAWDLVHHFYGNPIVPMEPTSSLGCAVCDPMLAIWYFFKAPSIAPIFTKHLRFKAS